MIQASVVNEFPWLITDNSLLRKVMSEIRRKCREKLQRDEHYTAVQWSGNLQSKSNYSQKSNEILSRLLPIFFKRDHWCICCSVIFNKSHAKCEKYFSLLIWNIYSSNIKYPRSSELFHWSSFVECFNTGLHFLLCFQ